MASHFVGIFIKAGKIVKTIGPLPMPVFTMINESLARHIWAPDCTVIAKAHVPDQPVEVQAAVLERTYEQMTHSRNPHHTYQ